MPEMLQILFPALIALFCTWWIHPYILKVAITKNIVDNPDARKLQRVPVPVLGGLNVVFGVLTGVMGFNLFGNFYDLFPVFASIIIILIIGLMDDMISLTPRVRFVVEIILVLFLIFTTGYQINDFSGLWGLQEVPLYLSVPLTVVASVGIINAINLIDGVDGYSSGYSIMACSIFGFFFYLAGDVNMVMLVTVCGGSLLPFFFHNVFGRTSKMFIGDGGTLVIGIVMSIFVLNILKSETYCVYYDSWGLGLVPFTLSVMSIPVFDTIRVMSMRILRGTSPFHPDKTHLHHLFISMGFSHIGTTVSILLLNLLVFFSWYGVYKAGCTINVQFYVCVAMSLLVTFGFYGLMRLCQRRRYALWDIMCNLGKISRVERKGIFLWLQHLMDGKNPPLQE